VADFTYVATWSGIVYVAFVVDVFSRAIVGWSAATSKRAKLVLDALDMALWRRDRAGTPPGPGLVHHSDAGSQYTSFAFTAHLIEAGIHASIGTVGEGGVGVESLLPELLAAGELVPLVGGALLKRQGEPRAERGSQNGYGTGNDGLHRPS
jgi:hypothetical protein